MTEREKLQAAAFLAVLDRADAELAKVMGPLQPARLEIAAARRARRERERAMNPIAMFRLARGYEKFKSIEKENVAMNAKILQITVLAATLLGTLGVPELAGNWLHAHAVAYSIFVAVGIVLHAIFPSIFSMAPSQAEQQAAAAEPAKQMTVNVVTKSVPLVLLALALGVHQAQAQAIPNQPLPTQSLYAAGLSYNAGQSGAQAVAGTALQAYRLNDSGTYEFSVMDVVSDTLKPFTVSTNVGVGVAQKIATIKGLDIYAPTAAGPAFNGANTGWQWSGGVITAIPYKGFYVLPSVRFRKASIGGSGYQPIFGVLFGWGK